MMLCTKQMSSLTEDVTRVHTHQLFSRSLQDWGARDPYAGEVVTQFGNAPLGGADTMHLVKYALLDAAAFTPVV